MKYGISMPPFTEARTIVEIAVEAEAAGWDGVFVWDHLQWSSEVRPDVLDPWVLLGAIAMVTERVLLGPMVTPLTRRRPVVIAKHVITLDHLSGGRAMFSVGLGEPPVEDFSAFGDEADPRVRGAMLDEALDVVDGLLRGGPFSHKGEHYVAEADLRPGPVTKPRPPIWVAGTVPNLRPLRRATRFDGVVPIAYRTGGLQPQGLADYLALVDVPSAGWDVVAPWERDVPAAEYEDAGATWLIASTGARGDWVDDFRERVRRGPR